MSAIDITIQRLETEEGFRGTAYKDTEGHLTIGYGFNVDAGITQFAAGALLTAQLQELHSKLLLYGWYSTLDETRQSVCLDIAFNAGLTGLLAFPHMIAALSRQDWPSAQTELLNSEAARAAPSRYQALGQLLLLG